MTMTAPTTSFIVRASCPDQAGIVARVTTCLFENGMNIEEAAQFNDQQSGHFFVRIRVSPTTGCTLDELKLHFAPLAASLGMDWSIHPVGEKVRTLVMVSKPDHCLNDLLYRWKSGLLPIDITAVASNHLDHKSRVEHEGLRFVHVPVNNDTRTEQEYGLRELITKTGSELIILARYMQILSNEFSATYLGRIINIHHSFLPAFKGAKPYHQAYNRGVKIIGATAHFATPDLDEGPIITQDIEPITHAETPDKLQIIGQDIEARVLAKAILDYAERRVFLHGQRTIIL